MSRAKPASDREPLDFYGTPDALAHAIARQVRDLGVRPSCVIEPSAGHGAFVRAALSVWPSTPVIAVDLCPDRRDELESAGSWDVVVEDWTAYVSRPRQDPPGALLLGNPPFTHAQTHVEAALRWMHEGETLCFLLRLNWLGSACRLDLWRSTPLFQVVPIVPRPSFVGGGSDATEYAAFIWRAGYEGPIRLSRPLVWRETKPRKAGRRRGSGAGAWGTSGSTGGA